MYYNEKRKAITAKYVKTHLDDIKIRVPKGQREKLKSIASEMGMSMNQMYIKAVEEYIERNLKNKKKGSNPAASPSTLSIRTRTR